MVPGACSLAGEMASTNYRVLAVIGVWEQVPWQGAGPNRGPWGWLSEKAMLGPSYPSAFVRLRRQEPTWFLGEIGKDQWYWDLLRRGKSEWYRERLERWAGVRS